MSSRPLRHLRRGHRPDATAGENCAAQAAGQACGQPSCHVPLFVIYPGTRPLRAGHMRPAQAPHSSEATTQSSP